MTRKTYCGNLLWQSGLTLFDSRVVKLLAGFAGDPEIERFTFLGAYSEK